MNREINVGSCLETTQLHWSRQGAHTVFYTTLSPKQLQQGSPWISISLEPHWNSLLAATAAAGFWCQGWSTSHWQWHLCPEQWNHHAFSHGPGTDSLAHSCLHQRASHWQPYYFPWQQSHHTFISTLRTGCLMYSRTLGAKEHTPHLHIAAATERNPTLPSSRITAQPLLPPVSHSTMCLVITLPAYHSQSLTYHWEAWGHVSQPSPNYHCWDLSTPPRSLRSALPEWSLPSQLAPTCSCHLQAWVLVHPADHSHHHTLHRSLQRQDYPTLLLPSPRLHSLSRGLRFHLPT